MNWKLRLVSDCLPGVKISLYIWILIYERLKMGDLFLGSVPPLDVALDLIRIKRNELLNQCDFYLLPDYPITEEKKTEWVTYRQQLRDITRSIDQNLLVIIENNGELEIGGITWPIEPS